MNQKYDVGDIICYKDEHVYHVRGTHIFQVIIKVWPHGISEPSYTYKSLAYGTTDSATEGFLDKFYTKL